jgi:hypothetical protein
MNAACARTARRVLPAGVSGTTCDIVHAIL